MVPLCFLLSCLMSYDHYCIHSHTDLCHASCLSGCYATIIAIPVIPAQSPVPHSFRSSVALRLMYLVSRQHLICCIRFVLPRLSKYMLIPLLLPPFASVLTCSWSNSEHAHAEGPCRRRRLSLVLQIWIACVLLRMYDCVWKKSKLVCLYMGSRH